MDGNIQDVIDHLIVSGKRREDERGSLVKQKIKTTIKKRPLQPS